MLGKFLSLWGLSVLICKVGESPFLSCPAGQPRAAVGVSELLDDRLESLRLGNSEQKVLTRGPGFPRAPGNPGNPWLPWKRPNAGWFSEEQTNQRHSCLVILASLKPGEHLPLGRMGSPSLYLLAGESTSSAPCGLGPRDAKLKEQPLSSPGHPGTRDPGVPTDMKHHLCLGKSGDWGPAGEAARPAWLATRRY